MKINTKNIIINSNATTKEGLFKKIANLAFEIGCVSKAKIVETGLWDREKQGSTGMQYGF